MMAINIKYSEAEKASFKIVPETCPAIERAMDKAFSHPDFSDKNVEEILAKYNIQFDRNLMFALDEIVGKMMFARKVELDKVVKYEGTFPLRAALVEEVRKTQNLPADRNRFTEWIEDHFEMEEYRKRRLMESV